MRLASLECTPHPSSRSGQPSGVRTVGWSLESGLLVWLAEMRGAVTSAASSGTPAAGGPRPTTQSRSTDRIDSPGPMSAVGPRATRADR